MDTTPALTEKTRSAVELTLSEDLLCRAAALTGDLSATVERLLTDFVRREEERRARDDATFERSVDAMDDFHRRHGFLADEFPSL